jgi:excisionase family DNA binding protein
MVISHRYGEGSRNMPSTSRVVFVVFLTHHEGMDATDLISTGKAAQLLGCSRQHVVDLCNEGKLPAVRKGGSHRYVRRSDVLALTDRSLTRDQEQSRWLHGAILSHLVKEPDFVLTRARENLDRFSKVHAGTMAEHWLDLWRGTLNSGPDSVLNVLVSDTPQARELRQNSPFTGILSEEERRTVLNSFREHWRTEH